MTRRRRDQGPQSLTAQVEQMPRPFDASHQLRQLLNVTPERLFRMDELAELRGFPSAEAARKFVRRYVPCLTRGRRLLVDLREFDRVCAKRFARKAS